MLSIGTIRPGAYENGGRLSESLRRSFRQKKKNATTNAPFNRNAAVPVFSIDRWLVPPKPKQPPASLRGKVTALQPYQLTLPYMRNNYVYLIFLTVYVLVNALLFGTRIYQYRNANVYTIFARAAGKSTPDITYIRATQTMTESHLRHSSFA